MRGKNNDSDKKSGFQKMVEGFLSEMTEKKRRDSDVEESERKQASCQKNIDIIVKEYSRMLCEKEELTACLNDCASTLSVIMNIADEDRLLNIPLLLDRLILRCKKHEQIIKDIKNRKVDMQKIQYSPQEVKTKIAKMKKDAVFGKVRVGNYTKYRISYFVEKILKETQSLKNGGEITIDSFELWKKNIGISFKSLFKNADTDNSDVNTGVVIRALRSLFG